MKNLIYLIMIYGILGILAISCKKKDDPTPTTDFKILNTYMFTGKYVYVSGDFQIGNYTPNDTLIFTPNKMRNTEPYYYKIIWRGCNLIGDFILTPHIINTNYKERVVDWDYLGDLTEIHIRIPQSPTINIKIQDARNNKYLELRKL